MAGLGKKTFEANEVLTAADVNGYLMDQSFMRFADASARSSAIGTPTEGMITYLDDVNQIEVYDGTAWVDQQAPILTAGTAGQYLQSNGTAGSQWVDLEVADDIITTEGDLIIGDSNGDAIRLAIGTADQVLTSNGTTATWEDAGGGGGETLISSQTETGFSGTITFSSIPQIYKDLKVILRFSGASTNNLDLEVEDNNDTNPYFFDGVSGTGNADSKSTLKYKPASLTTTAIHLFDYASNNLTPFLFSNAFDDSVSDADNFSGGGRQRIAGSITELIFSLGGTTDVTIELYGVS